MLDYWPVAACLAAGALGVWCLYGEGLRHYQRKNDHHGENVTIIAMFGTFLPFLGFAMISAMFVQEAKFQQCRELRDAEFDQWVDLAMEAAASESPMPDITEVDCDK